MTNRWDPGTYERFKDLRAQPFHDLVALLEPPVDAPAIVDLGCGTGTLTASLATTFPDADVLGIDSSPEMLEAAAARRTDHVRFEDGDIDTFERPGEFDVVISNAALHWTDDHAATLRRWAASLRPGGQLAVQLPANYAHPSHTVAEAVARDPFFRDRWTSTRRPADRGPHVLRPGAYAQVLHDLGFVAQSVTLRVYPMLLASSDLVVDWVRGTLLVPYRSSLSLDDYEEFERRYARLLAAEIAGPGGPKEPYFYGFERILMWGRQAP